MVQTIAPDLGQHLRRQRVVHAADGLLHVPEFLVSIIILLEAAEYGDAEAAHFHEHLSGTEPDVSTRV